MTSRSVHPNPLNQLSSGQGIEHLGFVVPNVQEAAARFQKAGGKLIMGGCEGCTAHIDMREQLGYIAGAEAAARRITRSSGVKEEL